MMAAMKGIMNALIPTVQNQVWNDEIHEKYLLYFPIEAF